MATVSSGNHKKNGITAKEKNREAILNYLSDPKNDFIARRYYSQTILNYVNETQVYQTLSPQELTQIESEAMENRKAMSAPQRFKLYEKLYDLGKEGNVTAIKEFLDRTEGKVMESHKHQISGADGGELKWTVEVVKPDHAEK